MMILFWALLVIFILVCIVLCFLVLIQSDKGGGISGAIGGGLGGANSLLGTQDTANILTKGTMYFGGAFFVLCIALSFVMSKQSVTADKSLLQKRAEKQNSYSPSSVLNNGGGLPIKQSDEKGAAAASGLPVQSATPEATPAQTSPAPEKAIPAASLPISPAKKDAKK